MTYSPPQAISGPPGPSGGPLDRTVVRLTLRGVVGRRRGLLLLALPLLLLALAVAVRLLLGIDDGPHVEQHDVTRDVLTGFALALLLPLVALIAGTGVIAPEIDDGSIIYLLAKPTPRRRIVHSKFVVAIGCTIAFAAVPIFLAGLIMSGFARGYAVAFGVAAALAGVAYVALFLLLGVVSRHAVVIGLVYVLLWEGLVGSFVPGAGALSIQQLALSVAEAIADPGAIDASVRLPVALIILVVVTTAATWFAGSRLRAFSLTGEQ